jgi:energy-coupling factor transporter transmembrane protein EcfT
MESFVVIILVVLVLFLVFKIIKTLFKWLLIGIIVVLAIAYFSNPSEFQHREGLKELTKRLSVEVKDNSIQVDNYKVFSLTKVKTDGKEKITGVGAFGKVWYFDDLKDYFKK